MEIIVNDKLVGTPEMQSDFYPLLRFIADGKNKEAKSMLHREMCKTVIENFGTFLHYAAEHNNIMITQHMIDMGSDIDSLNKDGRTPLMLAVEAENAGIVKILLKAGADVDIVGTNGKNALQMALYPSYNTSIIVEAFFDKIKDEVSSTEELIERLFSAGCTLHHAVNLNEAEVLIGLLQRGLYIESTNCFRQTALHIAVERNNLETAKILIENSANVNALDKFDHGPLYYAVDSSDVEMMQLLLDEGADLVKRGSNGHSSLLAPYYKSGIVDVEKIDRCVATLLQRGAVPTNERMRDRNILDWASGKVESRAIDYLIAHLVLLEMIGTTTAESVVRCDEVSDTRKIQKLEENYKLCQQILKIVMFDKLSLLDVLAYSEYNMRLRVRNEKFVFKIKDFCTEYGLDKCFYYHDTLMERISKAVRAVELEDEAIPVISEIFQRNENECYVAARKICGYLSEWDLMRLGRV